MCVLYLSVENKIHKSVDSEANFDDQCNHQACLQPETTFGALSIFLLYINKDCRFQQNFLPNGSNTLV